MFSGGNSLFVKGLVSGIAVAAIIGMVFYIGFGESPHDMSQGKLNIVIDQQGTIHTENGVLPIAQSLSPEAKEAMIEQLNAGMVSFFADCDPTGNWTDPSFLLGLRRCVVNAQDYPKRVARLHNIYPDVLVERTHINGIEVDIATPKKGVSLRNRDRVLLYLQGR